MQHSSCRRSSRRLSGSIVLSSSWRSAGPILWRLSEAGSVPCCRRRSVCFPDRLPGLCDPERLYRPLPSPCPGVPVPWSRPSGIWFGCPARNPPWNMPVPKGDRCLRSTRLWSLRRAQQQPEQQVVFLGVGFETTVPAVAWTLREAYQQGIKNYSVLCAHKRILPAMDALLRSETCIDGSSAPAMSA